MPHVSPFAIALLQQQLARPAAPTKTIRRFTVWNGSSFSPAHRTVADLATAAFALVPAGVWDEVELLVKAGEGGTWQSAFDNHPLAISGPAKLRTLVDEGHAHGLRITPYVVVRARPAWITAEQAMIHQCVTVAQRCILNVEPGQPYYNGPLSPAFIRDYLAGADVPASALEVCLIPRQGQVDELGGPACIQAWTDPRFVGSASFECYGLAAGIPGPTSLLVDEAIPRLDGWGLPAAPAYKIPVVQRDERARWADTPWCAASMQIWFLDG